MQQEPDQLLQFFTPPSTDPGTTFYRVLINATNSGCGQAVSNVVSAVIAPDLSFTAEPTDLTECIGATGQISVTVVGGSGTTTYQWQSSPNGSTGWANIGGATSSNFTPPSNIAGTFYFRVIVSNSGTGCDQLISSTSTVIIANVAVVSISVNNPVICIGGSALISSVVTLGSGNYLYQWQQSPAGQGTWSNITSGGTSSTYNVPSGSAGTNDYRLLVVDVQYGCGNPVSNVVNVVVQPQPSVAISANNNVVCIGGSAVITSTITDGSGSYLYQWQSSPDGSSWVNISSGGTGASYTAPTGIPGITYYRVLVTDVSNGCNDPVSDATSIEVLNQPTVSISVDNNNLCIGGIFTITSVVNNGSGLYNYQWQSSPNGSSGWANIAVNGNSANYTYSPVSSGTTYYRVIVTDLANGCNDPVSSAVSVIVHPQSTVTISVDNPVVCINGSANLTSSVSNGSGVFNYQWQSSPDGGVNWFDITINGNSSNYSAPTDVVGTIYYRVLVTDLANGCSDPVSNALSVTVDGQPTVEISADNNIICLGGSSTISSIITNGSGVYLYQWQSSPNGSTGWANVGSGGNGANYNVPSGTPGTTYYRVLVTDLSNGCNDPVSNAISIVVQGQPTVTIAADNYVVCIGGSSLLTSTVNNGSGIYLYQWQSSPNGSSGWSNINSGGTSSTYNVPTGSPGSFYYRVLVSDIGSGCGDPISNVVNIVIQNQPSVSISVDNNIVCIGGSSLISSIVTNGSGLYNYQWQSSPDGTTGWSNITPNGTSSTYSTIGSIPGTTYYRVIVTDLSSGCNDPVSNTVDITVENQPTVSIAVDNGIVCIGGSSNLTSVITNGSGLYNYQWQSSPNGSSGWANVPTNGTFSTYSAPTSSAGTTYYRLLVTDLANGCNDPISNTVNVVVDNQPTVDIAADNSIVCIGGSSTITATINNGSGVYLYQWQSSPDGSSGWANITSGGTSSTYSVPTSVAGTFYYRIMVTDLSNNCNDPVSSPIEIHVVAPASVSVLPTNTIVCVGGTSIINSTITDGSGIYLYQWQSSPNGSSWSNIVSGGTSSSYNVPTGTPGTTYYRLLLTDLANGCGDPISNTVDVTVVGQVSLSIAVDNPIVCINGSANITSTITNGSGLYNYQWQSSPDGSSGWTNIVVNGNSANYNAPTNTAGTTYYRLLLTDLANGCNDPISNVVSVIVNNQPSVSISVDNPIVCTGGISLITSVITNGSGLYNYQWQSSPDGSTGWSNIAPNGTSSTYSTVGLIPGTTYYRVLVTDLANGCSDPVSNTVDITVENQPTVEISVDHEIVCVGGSSTLTSVITNGSGLYNYQWQSSPDGSNNWINVPSNGTFATYSAPTSSAGTTYYRVRVTDLANGCNDPISNVLSVIVVNQPTVTIAADNNIVCIGGSSTITSTINNGSGFYTYQWQSSPNGSTGWANVSSNGNSANYNVPTSIAGTTFYRVIVTDLSSNCNDPVSSPVEIQVREPASVSVAPTNAIVCVGGSSIINSTITNGSGFYLYQWQSSPEGSSWSNINSGGTSSTYNVPTGSPGTTYYRLLLTDLSNGCADPVSNTVNVVVVNQVSVSVAVDNPVVCIGGSSTITSTITNGSGLFTYQWQSSPNGSSGWANIAVNGNSASYNAPTNVAGTTYYRLVLTDQANGCGDPISNVVSVEVRNQPTIAISVDNSIVCIGGISQVTSVITNGSGIYNYQWQTSPDGSTGWTNIAVNGNSANYTALATVAGTTYYRVLLFDLASGCNDPISNSISIVVEEQPTVSIVVDNDLVCIGGSSTLTSTITNGSGNVTYQWQSSPDGSSGWANIVVSGNGANYNAPTNTPGTTYYRVLVTDNSNGCQDPISNVLSVIVKDDATVTIQVDNNLICIGGNSTLTSTVLNGSGIFLYQWQASPNGSSGWSNVGTSSSYNAPSGVAGTTYYRVLVTDLNSGCSDPISNVLSVVVVAAPTVSISVDNNLVCVGGISILTSTITNGSGVYLYQWQSSPDGSSGWSNISPNGTSSSYTSNAIAPGTTYYRILVTDLSNGCSDPISNVLSIDVEP
jgi:hypothetical protein